MDRRATATAATAERILQATIDLHAERFHDQIALEDIAGRAGVTVQTVLRRFGSKDELIEAAADRGREQVVAQRDRAPVGDVAGAVANLMDHYEAWGPAVVRLLAQEDRVPQLRRITDRGRVLHAQWVRRTFAPFLAGRADPELLEAQLLAATDVYAWKVLRMDAGLDRTRAADAIVGTIQALTRRDMPHV